MSEPRDGDGSYAGAPAGEPATERPAGAPGGEPARERLASPASGAEGATASDPRVEEVLQSLRSGVRQRRAEAATTMSGLGGFGGPGGLAGGLGQEGGGLAAGLLAVRSHEYVQEPVPFSRRARVGGLIVWVRKAFFHLFLKWFLRPLLLQQNAFNQAAARLLQELAEAEERTAREVRLLAARQADLETHEAAARRPDPPP
jgi:hypothetical protein